MAYIEDIRIYTVITTSCKFEMICLFDAGAPKESTHSAQSLDKIEKECVQTSFGEKMCRRGNYYFRKNMSGDREDREDAIRRTGIMFVCGMFGW